MKYAEKEKTEKKKKVKKEIISIFWAKKGGPSWGDPLYERRTPYRRMRQLEAPEWCTVTARVHTAFEPHTPGLGPGSVPGHYILKLMK